MANVLLLSQVYPPDPAAVGQHLHEVARAMAKRGFHVRVLTSRAGFTDPRARYPRREIRDGVDIHRLAWGSLGKGSLKARAVGGLLFLSQALLRGLLGPQPTTILVSTSPPMAPAFGHLLSRVRRAPLTFWLMDLNPDQALATGLVREQALLARMLERSNRAASRASRTTVALDRFMADRVRERWHLGDDQLRILPPGSLDSYIAPIPHAENPFREQHRLQGKRVVMFSGNMSPVHPLDTLLQAMAAPEIRGDTRLAFVFIGAGGQRPAIEDITRREKLDNVTILDYQPLEQIRYTLSAADVHVVSMGERMVGVVHPCKVYGAMAAARPVFYLGPETSHIGQLIRDFEIGWRVGHGDLAGSVDLLRHIASASPDDLAARGERARVALAEHFAQNVLVGEFCDLLERGLTK